MRFPLRTDGEKRSVDEQIARSAIHRAVDLGVTLFDTAYVYLNGESEGVLGRALQGGYRERAVVCTKLPVWLLEDANGFDRYLDEQLARLGMETIDIYLLHALNRERHREKIVPFGVLERALRAREAGKIRFLGLSSHDTPEGVSELVALDCFDVLLAQYNILDRSYEEAIARAHELGLGVMAMGPVGGGRLAGPPEAVRRVRPKRRWFDAATALRFVLSNPHVHVALSGMSTVAMVEENVTVAAEKGALSQGEREEMEAVLAEHRSLHDCTACAYCMPCPQGVNIPKNLELRGYWKVYAVPDYTRETIGFFGKLPSMPGEAASACTACRECEARCPQGIPIAERLEELAAMVEGGSEDSAESDE